jgi:hypothetical protein
MLGRASSSSASVKSSTSSPKPSSQHVAAEEISSVLSKMGFFDDASSVRGRVMCFNAGHAQASLAVAP